MNEIANWWGMDDMTASHRRRVKRKTAQNTKKRNEFNGFVPNSFVFFSEVNVSKNSAPPNRYTPIG